MTNTVKIIFSATGGFIIGFISGYLLEKHKMNGASKVTYNFGSCDDITELENICSKEAVDHLLRVADEATKEENVPDNYIYESDELDEIEVSHEKLDAEHIPYDKGVRVIGDAEFAALSTSDDVESIELVYFAEDGMISEEGDIFSTMSETEIRKTLGDDAWDIVIEGGFDEVHFYNDHDYILYTVTRYDGAWGDMAAYAAGSGR